MMHMVGSLIEVDKSSLSWNYQTLPTVNVASRKSLHNWLRIRQGLSDFGYKYMLRIFLYCSTFIAVETTTALLLVLYYFNIITINVEPVLLAIGGYDMLIVMTVMLAMIYKGASYNLKFTEHIKILRDLKQALHFIKAYRSTIFDKPTSALSTPYVKIYVNMFKGYMHKNKDCENADEKIDAKIDNLIGELDFLVERLEWEKENKALKLLGFTASMELIKSIGGTLFTLGTLMAQRFFSSVI